MLRRCAECGCEYDRRRGPGVRCPTCQPEFERQRHQKAEEQRRRRKGVQPAVRRRGDSVAARAFNDGWFAGFADGEGCFAIGSDMRPAFVLSLRDDDCAILLELRRAFGGSLSWKQRSSRGEPCCSWGVSAKSDLQGLVAYFDRHPLRAKKRRDYAIWREAVAVYCARGCAADELPYLAAVLRHQRAYDAPVSDLTRRLKAVG